MSVHLLLVSSCCFRWVLLYPPVIQHGNPGTSTVVSFDDFPIETGVFWWELSQKISRGYSASKLHWSALVNFPIEFFGGLKSMIFTIPSRLRAAQLSAAIVDPNAKGLKVVEPTLWEA